MSEVITSVPGIPPKDHAELSVFSSQAGLATIQKAVAS